MGLIRNIGLWLVERTEPTPRTWKLEEGHTVSPAFVSDGVQYYMMKDSFNSFCGRALSGLSVYEQWEMRCSREFLVDWHNALDKLLNSNPIQLQEIIKLKLLMGERMAFALPTEEIVYQFASVLFFDESESPYAYDPEYGKQKIERWKKSHDIADFFLTVPIKTFIPLPNLSEQDLKTYYKVVGLIDEKHIKTVQEILSSNQPKAVTN